MDDRIRDAERRFRADPTQDNWLALVYLTRRARLSLDDLVVYRLFFDDDFTQNAIDSWNHSYSVKIVQDLWHYPRQSDSAIVWPGYKDQEEVFESLLDDVGIKWQYEPTKPWPEEAGAYDYSQPPPEPEASLRYNPRIRKMVKPKKHRASGKITKVFGDPKVTRPQYTYEELIRLKEDSFYNKKRHILFPEFSSGCQCGNEINHREWCSMFSTNKYRRNADVQLRDLERQLPQDPSILPRYLRELVRSREYTQADDALSNYLGPLGRRRGRFLCRPFWRLQPHLQALLPSIFDLGLMPGVYFEAGVESTSDNPTTLEAFIEELAAALISQYHETRRTLFNRCDKIDDDPVGPFIYAEKPGETGVPIYQENQQRWLDRLVIDPDWLETAMLRFSSVDRIKKGTKTKPEKTFYRIFIPAWALICIYGIGIATMEGFSRHNRWAHCHTAWHTKNIRRELNQSIYWPSGPPRKFTLNGLLTWKTTSAFREWLSS